MNTIYIVVISLIISTVYLRYHWVIDVILGAIMAFICVFVSQKIYNKWLESRKHHHIDAPEMEWFTELEKLKKRENFNRSP